jgi:putative PIN family toxin of toxin-antitoxin system
MKVVLDSNVLLVALGKRSRYKLIWETFVAGVYKVVVSEDILHEYEEILNEHAAPGIAELVLESFVESPDVIYQRVYYNWNIIFEDPDDNKFLDAAVAGNADFLVTNDSHFNVVKKSDFPVVNVINAQGFLELLTNNK